MTSSEELVESDAASALIEQLGMVLHELEVRKDASEDKVQWKEIEEHFRNLDTVLKKKFEELDAREKLYREKEAETHALLALREASVAAKEQDLLDRVQELKDAAIALIAEARTNHQPTLDSVNSGDNKEIKDVRRNSQQTKSGDSGGATGVQSDAHALELSALRAVIRCVKEYKLEDDYPLDPLQRRVAQLEKPKSDKKRAGDFGKHKQLKKSRPNKGYHGFRGGVGPSPAGQWHAPPAFVERMAYTAMPERYPHTGPNPYEYQVSGQTGYVQQVTDHRVYYNPQDDMVAASSYSAPAPPSYGSFIGDPMRSSHQPPYM